MIEKKQFENGLRLVTIPDLSVRSVTIFVLFAVGSRYEDKDINGASHFVEHLMFKGTKKRPNSLDISKALDSFGAEYNAATSKDWTGYYIKIDSRHLEEALDILSDMIYNSKFDAGEINKERGVILEEINMYQDNPLMYIEDILEQVVFKGSTLGSEIAGPKKVIREISRKKLFDYKNTHYVPEKTVIGIAGKIDNSIERLVKKYFQTTDKKIKGVKQVGYKDFVFDQKETRIKIIYKKTEQVQVALGFPAYGYFDPRVYALNLLSVILGGNMSSRLFISVREKRGLAYFVRCYPNIYQDTGCLVIQSGLDKHRVGLAIETIVNELRRIKSTGVTVDELKKAKEYLRGKVVLALEDTASQADWYAKQELLQNQILTPEQKFKKFDLVTVADIKKVAKEIFVKEKTSLALIGPFKDEKYFEKLLNL
ncbi:hypothetical protein A2533_03040 [Candidatus Falkowbacteria bacterium RIFOXYD2_FULL_35_9]|uniref:Peptidase M16 n=1 Tax=Candidatus Falkowbacteria bacterium RIFOXYC2_FULL_36_12 TaxID=1798002 RepID=A0A1F5SWA6_9BACT|nr:MAG: hypothetical protein A2478_00415 [Candidatus Falkowbacteria bacterium RIFOXYC2_FULL_36_12]OGF31550.1 MAG: hypothetical protein A2300_03655 [Candidatus Falkowbacteria bacterium RIFOXYB2_FULL_35_7]OGF33600.1 MAG: hypothetical protein A2223_03550 [Candidatus Falkowbacteria bacterium RIFOXYA2_FULL_35_8]OGF46951.1 MAG: hypothetical protein A2533_03040 [Candidatus Falkowbacteria bacterium RIFOXYD2_FULL_35_9]